MKRLITLLICFTLFCCFTGCRLGKQNKDVVDKNFYCKVIDENNIAIKNKCEFSLCDGNCMRCSNRVKQR